MFMSCRTEKDRDLRQRKNDRSAGIMYNVMHTHFPVCFKNIYTYINIVEGHKSSSDTIDRN